MLTRGALHSTWAELKKRVALVGCTWTQSEVWMLNSSMGGVSTGLVLRAPGMVSATDMTVMLLSSWSTVKLLPEVKVTVLGSQGCSRKALSLNLQQHSKAA